MDKVPDGPPAPEEEIPPGLIDRLSRKLGLSEGVVERGVGEGRKGGEARAQEAVVKPREEEGCAKTESGEAIADTVGQGFGQAVQADDGADS